MYVGTNFNDKNTNELKKQKKIEFYKIKNKSLFVAKKLVEKKVVGIFDGKMEYGPRALK